MLTCSGLRDYTGLAHLLRKESLTEYVVYLVRTGVVQILALEVDLRAAEILCHLLSVVEQGRSAGVLAQQGVQLVVELLVVLVEFVSVLKLVYFIHERFGDILSAEIAVASLCHIIYPFKFIVPVSL